MAKKRKASLPRVTVLAYNRRDLVAFADAVDKIISTQHELERMLLSVHELADKLKSPAAKAHETRRRNAASNGDTAGKDEPRYQTTGALV